MSLPGRAVPATVLRTPHGGGQPVQVLSLTLRRFLGVLFQPETGFILSQQGMAVTKRHLCFADWPRGVIDPIPVHAGDVLDIAIASPPVAHVQASPAPRVTGNTAIFSVETGKGAAFAPGMPATLGTSSVTILSVAGDVVTIGSPGGGSAPPSVPLSGQALTQSVLRYIVDDAGSYEGHHIELYVRTVASNA